MNAVIEKIRALRELARGTTNEHEAQAAARQAGRLAEKHRIAEAEIEAASGVQAPDPAIIDRDPVYQGGAVPGWKTALIHAIAEHFGCTIVRSRVSKPGRLGHIEQHVLLVGRAGDIELARETIAWLTLQIAALCEARAKGRGKAFRSAWSVGCVRGIHDQLLAGKREARAAVPATSTALVRLDARLAEAEKAVEHLPTRSVAPKVTDASAYARGRLEGQRMPITVVATEKRAVRAIAGAS